MKPIIKYKDFSSSEAFENFQRKYDITITEIQSTRVKEYMRANYSMFDYDIRVFYTEVIL